MKKTLLSLAVVASISTFGQDNGDLAGNLATESEEGYNFNFNVTDVDSGWDAQLANCGADDAIFNTFGNGFGPRFYLEILRHRHGSSDDSKNLTFSNR